MRRHNRKNGTRKPIRLITIISAIVFLFVAALFVILKFRAIEAFLILAAESFRRGTVFHDLMTLIGILIDSLNPYLNYIIPGYSLLTGLAIFMENKNPDRTIAWLLILFFLPVVGVLLYLFFGASNKRRLLQSVKGFPESTLDKTAKMEFLLYSKQKDRMPEKALASAQTPLLLLKSAKSPLSLRNRIEVLTNGSQTFPAIKESLNSAKNSIHLEYFIIANDHIGNEIRMILERKAKEGVAVRVIYDSVGSWKLGRDYLQSIKNSGADIRPFLPVSFPMLRRDLNYRNHRKIIVVDGHTGFTGGLNIGDEYLGKDRSIGFWRDTHLKIMGEAVYKLQDIFLKDWKFCGGDSVPENGLFPSISGSMPHLPMQIAASGPDSEWNSILHGFFSLINSAKKKIWLTTPYFIPDEGIRTALKVAALGGIDVKLILPGFADHKIVFWASHSYIDEMLSAGIRVFCYEKGFIHSKVLLVDDGAASVGTANIDNRSLDINFEVQAFIYDNAVVERLARDFIKDLSQSREYSIESRRKRSLVERVKESGSRLMSSQL